MAITSDLTGLGMSPALASKLGNNVAPVAGAGTTQATATKIVGGTTLATPAASNTGFILDSAASTTRLFFFFNLSATVTAVLYPPVGGSINGGAANAPISIAPLTGALIEPVTGGGVATQSWWAIVGGGGAQNAVALTQYSIVATNTPATLTGAQMAGGADVTIDMTAALAGAGTLNSATAAQIVAAIPNAQPGFSYNLRIINNSSGAFAWTLTTAAGITLNGTMTIAQASFRDFYVTLTSLTAVTIQNVSP
jgi:hypothetical protein